MIPRYFSTWNVDLHMNNMQIIITMGRTRKFHGTLSLLPLVENEDEEVQ
jgi:hypothetical protein